MRERMFEKHWPAPLNIFLSWHCRSSHHSIWRWQSSRTWHRHDTEIRIFILFYSPGYIFIPEHSIRGVCHIPPSPPIDNMFYFRIWLVQYIPCNGLLLFLWKFSTNVQSTATKAQYDNSKRIPLRNDNTNNYALKAVNVQPTKAYRERRYSPTHSWTPH